MTETDTKYWSFGAFHELRYLGDGRLDHGRVTGTVGDEQPIIRVLAGGQKVVIPWYDFDFHTPRGETPDLVVLHANVDGKYPKFASGGV